MTSLSTVSAGIKPPTSLPANRIGYHNSSATSLGYYASALQYAYTGGTGVQTAINITGSGVLSFLYFGSNAVSTSADMVVVIDGTTVLNQSGTNIQYDGFAAVGGGYWIGSAIMTIVDFVPFNRSLSVTVDCNVDATLNYVYYDT